MDFIDRIVERQIAEAMARGEFESLPGSGKPLDLEAREPGWWAEQFVRRERSRILHDEVVEQHAERRAGFWRAATMDELRTLVTEANTTLRRANERMVPADQLELVDVGEVSERWRAMRRPT